MSHPASDGCLIAFQGHHQRKATPPSRVPTPQMRQANGGSASRKVSYAEDEGEEASGSEADEDARRAAVAHKNAAVAALLEPDEMKGMDDEVERVLGHRWNPMNAPLLYGMSCWKIRGLAGINSQLLDS